jgi:hypothetical protein
MPNEWSDAITEFLIDERRRRNEYFHSIRGRSRVEFWESMARRIHRRFHTRFTAAQCETKWRNLVNAHRVSKIIL